MNNLLQSKAMKIVLASLVASILLVGAFALGMGVGERKANHFGRFSENYGRMFGSQRGPDGRMFAPPGGMMRGAFGQGFEQMMPSRGLPNSNGAFGKVLSMSASSSSFILAGQDNLEHDVLVTSSTAVRSGRDTKTFADIKPDSDVSVFGVPNEKGEIEAKLIRIFQK